MDLPRVCSCDPVLRVISAEIAGLISVFLYWSAASLHGEIPWILFLNHSHDATRWLLVLGTFRICPQSKLEQSFLSLTLGERNSLSL